MELTHREQVAAVAIAQDAMHKLKNNMAYKAVSRLSIPARMRDQFEITAMNVLVDLLQDEIRKRNSSPPA
jgi:hypothetical protein